MFPPNNTLPYYKTSISEKVSATPVLVAVRLRWVARFGVLNSLTGIIIPALQSQASRNDWLEFAPGIAAKPANTSVC
ncbi:MAG: hypothetical protein SH856_10070 [Flavobacteriales bacterium]|nr:hypothetical protein [Flavobacteriales bacterium]